MERRKSFVKFQLQPSTIVKEAKLQYYCISSKSQKMKIKRLKKLFDQTIKTIGVNEPRNTTIKSSRAVGPTRYTSQ